METTLISGGAGFIGSHLVDHFIERNHKVIIIDSLYTGKIMNLSSHIGKPNFLFIKKDISLMNPTYRFSSGKIDNVLHFASPASPIHYQKLAFVTMRANSIGTEFMLDVAREHNARFLLASTSEIYGDPLEHPQKET
ncbi:MAG: GDP-mannose 4,6-dehydratase, partial [archaeon]